MEVGRLVALGEVAAPQEIRVVEHVVLYFLPRLRLAHPFEYYIYALQLSPHRNGPSTSLPHPH